MSQCVFRAKQTNPVFVDLFELLGGLGLAQVRQVLGPDVVGKLVGQQPHLDELVLAGDEPPLVLLEEVSVAHGVEPAHEAFVVRLLAEDLRRKLDDVDRLRVGREHDSGPELLLLAQTHIISLASWQPRSHWRQCRRQLRAGHPLVELLPSPAQLVLLADHLGPQCEGPLPQDSAGLRLHHRAHSQGLRLQLKGDLTGQIGGRVVLAEEGAFVGERVALAVADEPVPAGLVQQQLALVQADHGPSRHPELAGVALVESRERIVEIRVLWQLTAFAVLGYLLLQAAVGLLPGPSREDARRDEDRAPLGAKMLRGLVGVSVDKGRQVLFGGPLRHLPSPLVKEFQHQQNVFNDSARLQLPLSRGC